MTYTVFVYSSKSFRQEDIESYFEKTGKYKIVKENLIYQFSYFNNKTGAYFMVDYSPEKREKSIGEYESTGIAFVLNYWRPPEFAQECMQEIEDFCKRFGFFVFDPQDEIHSSVRKANRTDLLTSFDRSNTKTLMSLPKTQGVVAKNRYDFRDLWNSQREKIQREFPGFVVPEMGFKRTAMSAYLLSLAFWDCKTDCVLPPVNFVHVRIKRSLLGMSFGEEDIAISSDVFYELAKTNPLRNQTKNKLVGIIINGEIKKKIQEACLTTKSSYPIKQFTDYDPKKVMVF